MKFNHIAIGRPLVLAMERANRNKKCLSGRADRVGSMIDRSTQFKTSAKLEFVGWATVLPISRPRSDIGTRPFFRVSEIGFRGVFAEVLIL